MNYKRPLVIAHRGFAVDAPESTMMAFRKAREAGADGIEIDVRLTKDNEVVVMHDERVNRTTNGNGIIGNYTLAELLQLDAGSWFSEKTAGERVPTFRQVCEFIAEWGGLVNVELEKFRFQYPGLEERVIKMVYEYGIARQVIFSSFNHEALRLCKELAPEIPTAPLYSEILFRPWEYAKLFGASALHPQHRNITKEIVHSAQAAGIEVRPWVPNEPADVERLLEYGVDGFITDRPDTVLQMIGR